MLGHRACAGDRLFQPSDAGPTPSCSVASHPSQFTPGLPLVLAAIARPERDPNCRRLRGRGKSAENSRSTESTSGGGPMRRYVFRLAILALALLGPSVVRASDQEIAQQIVQKLQAEKQAGTLKGFSIDLQVEEGTVWMSGRVANEGA